MRISRKALSFAVAAAGVSVAIVFSAPFNRPVQGQVSSLITNQDLLDWVTEFSNHGRWENVGLGAANLITPHKRLQASRLVHRGISVSMAHNVPQTAAEDPTFLDRVVLNPGVGPFISDRYQYQGTYHGATHSHLDALGCHVHFQGRGWNNLAVRGHSGSGVPGGKGRDHRRQGRRVHARDPRSICRASGAFPGSRPASPPPTTTSSTMRNGRTSRFDRATPCS